jgi:hypothetical protein
VISRPDGLALCDIVPQLQEHLNRSFNRTHGIIISDDFVAESLPLTFTCRRTHEIIISDDFVAESLRLTFTCLRLERI